MIQLQRGLLWLTMVNKSSEYFELRICQLIPMVNRNIKFLFIYIIGTKSNICSWQYSLTCKCFFFHRLILSSNKLDFCGELQTTGFHYLPKNPQRVGFLCLATIWFYVAPSLSTSYRLSEHGMSSLHWMMLRKYLCWKQRDWPRIYGL